MVIEVKPFAQWGLDFVGPINPPSSAGHRYILTVSDYFTRCTKALACKQCTSEVVINFLESGIINHFGCPIALVCDNGPTFASLKFSIWAFDHGIIIKFSSNYYPQGNNLVESSNKNILIVIYKLLERNPKDWHTQIKFSLWADRTRHKDSIGTSPYHLMYGFEPMFPIQLKIPTLQFINDYYDEGDRREALLAKLLHLEEKRDEALEYFAKHQGVVKR